ncbi:gamma-type small acid-soluble spore protein [Aquibacillus sediminis]|uniref:gamma-type small acid-soluble spore protein n=1 Tax=Aquibacillus sediminis TaxID=2574734 RepID=UPI0011092075|nr:gamma-type small acid-soluble spore protein [Aquibacillus sediminis]
MNDKSFTTSGTNINEVKRKNAQSGMSYNEAKNYIAKTTGGHNTQAFSDTDISEIRNKLK